MLKETPIKLSGNDRFEGFGVDLIKELSSMLGFNYTFITQEDGQNGNYDRITKKWNGMIGEIMAQVLWTNNFYYNCFKDNVLSTESRPSRFRFNYNI